MTTLFRRARLGAGAMKAMVEKPNSPPKRIRRIVLWQPSGCGMSELLAISSLLPRLFCGPA
ncbi:MAG: hypothetical protein A3F73_13720 [Gallionellales bacterium RIFCSPLOWO2_12_FULL_59_22]|nr:MAG: hypothetical protein A2Z65_10055 [Gallionellales bacterium RIFCSPLOWO2_02_58_13]OGT10375.1 MAG: hypothetical protein A3F73_13720 [Gallionellales bacterium RIFCSPLOWO2_12_FULL_59_22]